MERSNKAPHKSHVIPSHWPPASSSPVHIVPIPFPKGFYCFSYYPFAEAVYGKHEFVVWSHEVHVSFGTNRIQRSNGRGGKRNVHHNSQKRYPAIHCWVSEIAVTVFPHLIIIIKFPRDNGKTLTGNCFSATVILLELIQSHS